MKRLNYSSFFVLGSFSLLLLSCGGNATKKGGGTKKFVSQSGWKPNDKYGWFFTGKNDKSKAWPNMVYVEGGTFTMGLVKDDVMHDWNNTPRRMQVSSFYLGETETTNYDYRSYVTWIKYVFPPSNPDYKALYDGVLPDTLVWANQLSRNDFSETYFRSNQFDYYPVVGVTWEQAVRYCDWLTDRANERVLMDEGIISKDLYTNESNNYGTSSFTLDKYKANDPEMLSYVNEQRLRKKTGIYSENQRIVQANLQGTNARVQKFRLPTEVEWEFAALGLEKNREYNLYEGKQTVISQLRGKKGRNRGMFLDNFKYGRGDYSGVSGWKNDGSSITSDVRQYPSNDLGLYGMYGNVAEWTADVYRPIIDDEASDFNYFRGNQNVEIVRNMDGSSRMTSDKSIVYDTLADGRIIYKRLPGEFERKVVADYSNYRDGDFISSLQSDRVNNESIDANFSIYNSPKKRFRVDENGRVIMEKDTQMRTSAISNEIRVVKGGSWKDVAYWLDPGQRRFRNQLKAYGWIGFRVAQDAKSNNARRTKR